LGNLLAVWRNLPKIAGAVVGVYRKNSDDKGKMAGQDLRVSKQQSYRGDTTVYDFLYPKINQPTRGNTMKRKVKVFKYEKTHKPGKSYFDKVPDGEATFHAFGCDYEEFEEGPGNFSTAIIERKDGAIENVPVEMIKFIK
jgi:hypothetical protein